MLTTTLNAIRAHHPCSDRWAKLLRHLGKIGGDDEPLPFAVIVESNGLDDALWACETAPQYNRQWYLFAVWCARQVQHLMQDPRSIAALDVVERYASGVATKDELDAARDAAWDAAGAAVWDTAGAAAWGAARAAAWATQGATRAARGAAARDAAWAAAWAAEKPHGGYRGAAAQAAEQAARAAQQAQFLRIVAAHNPDDSE